MLAITFFRINFDLTEVVIRFNLPLLAALVVAGIIASLLWRRYMFGRWKVVKATLKIGQIGEIEISPNKDVISIAHKAWVELSTRKVALPFDEDHDVVVEIYNSWYACFGKLRDLAKDVPADNVARSSDTQKLLDILVAVLNKGMRPHLTRWQARFRAWYEVEIKEPGNAKCSPQEIQKKFPHYSELVSDLTERSKELTEFAEILRALSVRSK